jgi:hypothetical protein
MADEPKQLEKITPDDVKSVTEHLQKWAPTLPQQEQLVLGWILTRAAAAEDADANEYASRVGAGVPVSTLMADAAGLHDVAGHAAIDSIGPIKIWTYRW